MSVSVASAKCMAPSVFFPRSSSSSLLTSAKLFRSFPSASSRRRFSATASYNPPLEVCVKESILSPGKLSDCYDEEGW